MTQEQLAELVNVAPRHISFIETGRSFPSCELLERICKVLQVDFTEVVKTEENLTREELLQKLNTIVPKLNDEQLNYLVKLAKELY